jgi:hypothetical protein
MSIVNDPVFTQQRIWKVLGNRHVEAHIRSNIEATERELLEIGVSFAALPDLKGATVRVTTRFN